MEKQKKKRNSFLIRKRLIFALHCIAFCLFIAGVSMVYCNTNFKKGLRWLDSETFEESPAFDTLFTEKTKEILGYCRYRDVFESGGEVDMDNEVLAYSTGTGDEIIWTLSDVLEYAREHGYSFDNDYHIIHDASAPGGDGQTYPVTWRAYRDTDRQTGPGAAFETLDFMVLEVMNCLGEYYRGALRYNTGNSNLYYYIELEGRRVYTNRADLTPELAKSLGKYVILDSDDLSPNNNLTDTPTAIRDMILEETGSRDSAHYVILAVDTSYPLKDAFYEGVLNYAGQRTIYLYGLILMLVGGVFMMVSFIILLFRCGHGESRNSEVVLTRFDRRMPELNILTMAALCIILIFVADKTAVRVLHMLLPSSQWVFSEKMLNDILVYICAMPCIFSAVRAWKAGILWDVSLLKQIFRNVHETALHITFARRYAVYFIGFVMVNTVLAGSVMWLVLKKTSIMSRLSALGLLAVLAAADLWFFHKAYRKNLQRDRIAEAIRSLNTDPDSGENLLPPEEFEGQEAQLADTINNIGSGLNKALDDRVRSERMKAELITNVSHDIKTPLTSIINYVDLIKREKPENEKIRSYISILEQKSQHLKTLTEDLVEASKASTGNVQIDAVDIDFVELVEQTTGEFEERFAERDLLLVTDLPKEAVMIRADGQHLWRVLENLYNNAFKYAAAGSRVYVDMAKAGGRVTFTIKNISARPLNISPEELTERFVRGDASRTTEGSGLGLSIAKNLTELQHGVLNIVIDGDYFKASVTFDVIPADGT